MSTDEATVIRTADRPGDLGWMIMAHGELYAREYGWTTDFEALVAGIVAEFASDHDPRREAAWIAESAGRRVGCVLCVADRAAPDGAAAKLRILLVDPAARGQGLGGRLVDTCVAFARSAGYDRIGLWTNDVLDAARRIYRDRGFELVQESPHRSFGQHLVGQTWSRPLTGHC